MKIYNSSKNSLIADQIELANNPITRTIGLISKKCLEDGEGLLIKPCFSIHTFFMKFPIDVLFINKKNEVVAVHREVKPWRILPLYFNSQYVIELKSGEAEKTGIEKGDLLNLGD